MQFSLTIIHGFERSEGFRSVLLLITSGPGTLFVTQFSQCPIEFTTCKTGPESFFLVDEALVYETVRLLRIQRIHCAWGSYSAKLRGEEFVYIADGLFEGKRQAVERLLGVLMTPVNVCMAF